MPRARLLAPILALALAACGGEPPPPGALLISIDSLRADHLSSYGYRSRTAPGRATSPRIDARLADEGTSFDRAVSTTSWTLPSHMAMLTGLPDDLHGVQDQGDRLHPAVRTLAQAYERAGWRAGGFFSGPNVHPWFGFGRGFEVYVDCSSVATADEDLLGEGGEELRAVHDDSHAGVTGPAVRDAFTQWFATVGDDEPFFAFVHLWDVHYDYEAPAEFDVFSPDYGGPIDSGDHRSWAQHWPITEADWGRILAMYDAEILFTDSIVGELLDALEEAGRLDDTAIVLTSDHGEEFAEHGAFGHRTTLFEEVVRIPLIVRLPGVVPAGHRVDATVSLVDVAPTLLELSGLPRVEGMWGRSLVPAFDGELPPRAAPLALHSAALDIEMRGWHGGQRKVLQTEPGTEPLAYLLDKDPKEQRPRKASVGPAIEEAVSQARALLTALDEDAAGRPRLESGGIPADLAGELIKAGYTGVEEEE